MDKENSFSCDVCAKTFKRKDVLNEHRRIHTGEKPFKCKLCDKSYVQRSGLREHEFRHSGNYPYKCEECGKGFAKNAELKLHIMMHNNIKPFKCDYCDKAFVSAKYLKFHQICHFGEKKYKCDKCDISFGQPSALKMHTNRVHGANIQLPDLTLFKCDICGKSFANESNLKRHHKMIHSERIVIKCDLCKIVVHSKAYLRIHKQKHCINIKEKLFQCDRCDKSYAFKSYLEKHQMFKHGTITKSVQINSQNFKVDTKLENQDMSDANSESVEDQEEDLAFFCGICDERITSDSDVYDIHIQGNCPEKVDDNETESLTVVPVKFEEDEGDTDHKIFDQVPGKDDEMDDDEHEDFDDVKSKDELNESVDSLHSVYNIKTEPNHG